MKKVSILVLDKCTPMSPIGAMEIIRKAGDLYQQMKQTRSPFFDVELVGVKNKKVNVADNFHIDCHTTLDQVSKTDLLLIPAMEFDVEEKLKQNKSCISHILRLHKKGVEIGSMCTGAFLLASTGLLNNKSATTHWYAATMFRSMFPKVRLLDEKIIVDENGIYTSGGAASSLNLCLYLVEKYCGKEAAVLSSKMLLMDMNNHYQLSYSMFIPQVQHNDQEIGKAQKLIETSPEKLSIDQLAQKVNLSRRSFVRRFKASTGNTPIGYIQRMNVEKAKRKLETTNNTIENIFYSLGYNDLNSFRKLFMKYTALSPREYRKKYKRI